MKVLLVILTALAMFVGTATAAMAHGPCPINQKTGKCVKPSVSYSYIQPGHDQFGNKYTRVCHVPLHGKRWCGPWKAVPVLRRAFVIHKEVAR